MSNAMAGRHRKRRSGGCCAIEGSSRRTRRNDQHTSRRFSAERANECWQIDATKWQLPNGLWVEIINVIDDCTRLLIASTAVGVPTANSWDALCHGAARWGWPSVSYRTMGLRSRAGQWRADPSLLALGIRDPLRPYHPQTCGKIERFHQTLKLHLRCQDAVTAIDDLQRQLDRFSDYYNHRRPHRAIGRRIPADVWAETRSGPADRPLNAVTSTSLSGRGDGRIRIGDKTRISLGALHAGQSAQVVLTGRVAHVFINGRLVRQLEIDPAKRNQPLYTQGGHPRKRA
ncbi:MAG: transposase [Acidimicrobiaceae bacterium]|nr:transposase [Acidimicrobiaceae bacterium]